MHTDDTTGLHNDVRSVSFDVRAAAASVFVVVVLGLQAYIGFTRHTGYYWPITSYPMYSQARHDGDRLGYYSVFVEAEGMERTEITPEALNIGYWVLVKNVVRPMRDEGQPGNVAQIAGIVCRDGRKDFQLLVYDRGGHISRNGPVFDDPKELARSTVSCAGGA